VQGVVDSDSHRHRGSQDSRNIDRVAKPSHHAKDKGSATNGTLVSVSYQNPSNGL
jgi:hypothetical protein